MQNTRWKRMTINSYTARRVGDWLHDWKAEKNRPPLRIELAQVFFFFPPPLSLFLSPLVLSVSFGQSGQRARALVYIHIMRIGQRWWEESRNYAAFYLPREVAPLAFDACASSQAEKRREWTPSNTWRFPVIAESVQIASIVSLDAIKRVKKKKGKRRKVETRWIIERTRGQKPRSLLCESGEIKHAETRNSQSDRLMLKIRLIRKSNDTESRRCGK